MDVLLLLIFRDPLISKFKMKFFGNRNSSLSTNVAVGSSDPDNGPPIEEKQVGAICVNDDSSLERMPSQA